MENAEQITHVLDQHERDFPELQKSIDELRILY